MTTYPLRHVRLRPGEELRETVEVPVEAFTLGGQSYVPVPALVGVELSIQRATSGDVFRIVLDLGVTGPCMRCLADASARVEIDTREYQAADPGAEVLRERARKARERMTMAGGRETLGFALVLLRRD